MSRPARRPRTPVGTANGDEVGWSVAHDCCGVPMTTRVVLQADLKSNGVMELISIGEAARRVGLNASALRYYEERGLVRPAGRHGGRRMYGQNELRRLAFVQLLQRLGVGLDTAAAVLDWPS